MTKRTNGLLTATGLCVWLVATASSAFTTTSFPRTRSLLVPQPDSDQQYLIRGDISSDKWGISALAFIGVIVLFTAYGCARAIIDCYKIEESLAEEENNTIATVGLSEEGDDDEMSLDFKDTEDIEANTTNSNWLTVFWH